MFHVRHLHLGHLAKAFALREAPSSVSGGGGSKNKHKTSNKGNSKGHDHTKVKDKTTKSSTPATPASVTGKPQQHRHRDRDDLDEHDVQDAERRMEKVVRAQGRLTKKGGKMVSSGTEEFQIAGGYDLERLVGSR